LIIGSGFLGIATTLLFFFCPETTYRRDTNLNIDLGTIDHSKESGSAQRSEIDKSKEDTPDESAWTFIERLRLWRGIESQDNLFKIIIRPVSLLLFPQVLYGLVTGLSAAWLSVLYGIVALIFGSAPYNLSVSHLGIMLGVGGLISTVIGFATAPLSDWLCKYLARRNNGTYEPEVYIPFEKILTLVSSCDNVFHVSFWDNWIFWIWDYASLSASVDYTVSLILRGCLRTFNSQHRDVCIYYGLSP
jgi:hypothetical protein